MSLVALGQIASNRSSAAIVTLFFLGMVCSVAIASYRHMASFHTTPSSQQSTNPREPIAISSTSLATGTLRPLLSADDGATTNTNDENDRVQRVHVIILVHGWIGCPQDLGYMHHALEQEAANIVANQQDKEEPFYVYTCESNKGRTNDGIQAGADRIAKEVEAYLQGIQAQNDGNVQEISLSIVGYSLGGLYARYALPRIVQVPSNPQTTPRIVPKVFCSVATPHLGSRGHMWLRFPKFMEQWLSLITQTGRDLFHHTTHIQDTITDPYWIEPLLQFEKRIAYANTYSMDLMVPTSTAAFLSEQSKSQHFHQVSPSSLRSLDVCDANNQTNNPFVALVVETPAQHDLLRKHQSLQELDMAQRLDAMGWTKVFVDFADGYRAPMKPSYTSSALHHEFRRSKKKLFWPVGHDLVVVNSKNVLSSYAMRRGRPLVDQLARDLVQDIVLAEHSLGEGTCSGSA